MAFKVSSLPSLTIILGRPRSATSLSNSRATRMPDNHVSTGSARHSLVQSAVVDDGEDTEAAAVVSRTFRTFS
ncbi:hypothetical protein ASC75_19860 [Aminobacter sp. DSM 101952]|nr:hypothetical protein BG46_06510 [Brucella anthropi]KQU75111.1 hypothetical protein ASC75_19860 [Aminobacter sp. DSM 101952]